MEVCQECNVRLESMKSYLAHINGKRHQKILKLMEVEKSKLERQAYVSWKKEVTKNDIESFVSTFGVIKSLYVNDVQKYAIVDFEQAESCSKFLSNDKHKLESGKEIIVKKRLNSKKRPASSLDDTPQGSTNSSNSPSKPTKRARILEDPTSETTNSNIVNQSSTKPPTDLIDCAKEENGGDGNVKKEKINKESNKISMKIIEELMQSKSVDEQMTKLVESIQLQKVDFDNRHELAEHLTSMARRLPNVSNAEVHISGSSANGMGVEGCDLDLILNVTSEMDTAKVMKLMRKQLYSSKTPAFKDIMLIPSKRCPIIRFHCPYLDLKCDLSFNNRLAIRNTEVLRHLGLNVPPFRTLCFVLRKWMAGAEVLGPKMTHYALYMLVWFYIRSKFDLPSFEELSLLCDKELIDQWDCTFPFNLPQLIQVEEHSFSLQELLVDFFDFFKDLDFKDKVLSIRSGKIISFDEMENLEPFKKADMMVQDPFLLEHNITQNVTNLSLASLQNACKEASSTCALESFHTHQNDRNVSWGIILLLAPNIQDLNQ